MRLESSGFKGVTNPSADAALLANRIGYWFGRARECCARGKGMPTIVTRCLIETAFLRHGTPLSGEFLAEHYALPRRDRLSWLAATWILSP